MTEATPPATVEAAGATLSRSGGLLQDLDRAFRMVHGFVTGSCTVTLGPGISTCTL
jgi:hypothetical protein